VCWRWWCSVGMVVMLVNRMMVRGVMVVLLVVVVVVWWWWWVKRGDGDGKTGLLSIWERPHSGGSGRRARGWTALRPRGGDAEHEPTLPPCQQQSFVTTVCNNRLLYQSPCLVSTRLVSRHNIEPSVVCGTRPACPLPWVMSGEMEQCTTAGRAAQQLTW